MKKTLRAASQVKYAIGLLTAISMVSGRLARKIAMLERCTARRGGEKQDGKPPATHAD